MALLGDELLCADGDEEARARYVKAAASGHVGAMNAAADWHRDGFGGPVPGALGQKQMSRVFLQSGSALRERLESAHEPSFHE
jgi:hypothetical protein